MRMGVYQAKKNQRRKALVLAKVPHCLAGAAATQQIDDGQQDDGAQEGNQQRRNTEVIGVDGAGAKQRRQLPCSASVFMTMLASQPRIPPTTIQIMNNMLIPPQVGKTYSRPID